MCVGSTPMSGLSSGSQLTLIDTFKSQAFLIISPPAVSASESSVKARRSTIFSVPYSVPLVSTIANAMLQSQEVNQNLWIHCHIPVNALPPPDSDKNIPSFTSPQIESTAYGLSSWATSQRESEPLRSECAKNFQTALNAGAYADAAAVFSTWYDQEAKSSGNEQLEQDVRGASGRRAAQLPNKKTQIEPKNKVLPISVSNES